jgi:hypothetical protein
MRIFLALTMDELSRFARSEVVSLSAVSATAVTDEFSTTVESADSDELDLLAALSALDVRDNCVAIAALDLEAEVIDAALGEVQFSAELRLEDIACFLIADVEQQELMWFGIQELDQLMQKVKHNV